MDGCLFCRVAAGEVPAQKLYEDERLVAFYDINPQAPVHFLVVPKEHIPSAAELNEAHGELLGHMFAVIARLCRELGCGDGYRLVSNVGEAAGQTVKHLHIHVLAYGPQKGEPAAKERM